MNKFIGFVLIGCLSSLAFAQTPQKQEVQLKQPPFPMADTKFSEVKLLAVHSIEKRLDSLKKELACVESAKDRNDMTKCFNDAQERRQEIAQELRENKKTVKEIKK